MCDNERILSILLQIDEGIGMAGKPIYGSYSKGNANEWSDIDVAVISPDFSEDMFDERLKLMKIAANIDDRIEPHPFRVEDFDKSNPLVSEIKKYGILLS
mgnify:CR=1 FL=1